LKNLIKYSVIATSVILTACTDTNQQAIDANKAAESAAAANKTFLGDWGVDLSARKLKVKPGDDFFQYANGSWLEDNDIPNDRASYGLFDNLRDRSQEQMRAIIQDLDKLDAAEGTPERKVRDYFASWMNVEAINKLGIEPLRPDLNDIAAIKNIVELVAAFGASSHVGSNSPISVSQGIDRLNPDRYLLDIGLGGLGLPDRDLYLQGGHFERLRGEYKKNIDKMLSFADIEDTEAKAETIIALETKLANLQWPRSELRNSDKTLNPSTLTALQNEHKGIDWAGLLAARGVDGVTELNISHPDLIAPLVKLINETPLDDWKAYLSYHLIRNNANLLAEEMGQANFHFWGRVLGGQPEQPPRWKGGTRLVGDRQGLGEALGKIYVERYFPESAKQQMLVLVENLRKAYGERIDALPWMSDETKKQAHIKLAAFLPKIGYPDQWLDLSGIEIKSGDLFGNARRVGKFFTDRENNRLFSETNREEWFITPHTVNAFYNPSFNEILFPAAFLQPPFFDQYADPAVNYGAIGAVIGHELGHGFDDQGSKFDAKGVQRNWWTDADRKAFEKRTAKLGKQYDKYEAVPGHFVDGNFTMGENIGDLGGATVAYHAYKLSLSGQKDKKIDGLTGDQRFFLSFAQIARGKVREKSLIQRLKADPHSPAEFRANGVVRNMDEWYDAFNVGKDDALYLAPEDRVLIW